MSLAALRPAATPSTPSDPPVVGAASIAEALSDNSDASYVTFSSGQSVTLNLSDFTLPAGAVMKHVSLRVRLAAASGDNSMTLTATADATGYPSAGGSITPSFSSPTTVTLGSQIVGWTDTAANFATLTLTATGGGLSGGFEELRVHEAYFDVIYLVQPSVGIFEPTGLIGNTNQPVVEWTATFDPDA